MKKIFILAAIILSVSFTGCSTKYETILSKDVSVKIRSIWADVDYDSRVCDSEPLEHLPAIKDNGFEPLAPIATPR